MLTDTSPDAHRKQIALLRAAGPSRRYAMARSLTRTVVTLSRRAIQRRHPELDEREIGCLFVSYTYGKELGDRVREHLRKIGVMA